MKNILTALLLTVTLAVNAQMVSVKKLITGDCPANYFLAAKQMDTICREEPIVYTIFNYLHKDVVNITYFNWYVSTVNMNYSQPIGTLGGRIDGMGITIQDVIGENPPSGTGTSGEIIETQIAKLYDFNIATTYKNNADGTITVTSKLTALKRNTSTTLVYVSYLQDNDLFPNEFRQFVTPFGGIALPKCRAGASKTYKSTITVAPYLGSKSFNVVAEISDSNGTMYNHYTHAATITK